MGMEDGRCYHIFGQLTGGWNGVAEPGGPGCGCAAESGVSVKSTCDGGVNIRKGAMRNRGIH